MSLFTGSVEQKFYDDTFDKMLKKIKRILTNLNKKVSMYSTGINKPKCNKS